MAADDELAEADLAGLLQRVAEDDIGLGRGLVLLGRHEIGLVEVERVDLALVDELDEVDGALRLELDVVDLLVGEEDVLALLDLVALDDVLGIDRRRRPARPSRSGCVCRSACGSG